MMCDILGKEDVFDSRTVGDRGVDQVHGEAEASGTRTQLYG